MRSLASVVALGARTPAGLRAVDTAFSFRASGVSMREAPLVDPDGEPITMCFQPTLEPTLVGVPRALALAGPAFDEVLEPLGEGPASLRVALALGVDPAWGRRDGPGASGAQRIAEDLARRGGKVLREPRIEVAARGAASIGFLLPRLLEGLAAGTLDLAIVGAVHTDYEPQRIAELATTGRLFRPDRLDALIPGEHAAFFALARADVARRAGLPELATIVSCETAHEKARPDNDEPAFEAAALTAAMRRAFEPLGALRAGWMLTDLTFETFRHHELHAARLRTQRHLDEPQRMDSPAQRMGHLGAAAIPLHVVLAAEGFVRGWAPHGICVSVSGSDAGERAVVVLAAPAS